MPDFGGDDLLKELGEVLGRYGFSLKQAAYAQQIDDDDEVPSYPEGTIEESAGELAKLLDADITIVLHCERQQKHLH